MFFNLVEDFETESEFGDDRLSLRSFQSQVCVGLFLANSCVTLTSVTCIYSTQFSGNGCVPSVSFLELNYQLVFLCRCTTNCVKDFDCLCWTLKLC